MGSAGPQVIERIEGKTAANTIIDRIQSKMDKYRIEIERQQSEVRQREERVRLQKEQQEAYEEALAQERARAQSLQDEQDRKRREEEERRREEEEARKKVEDEEKRQIQLLEESRNSIPPEPTGKEIDPLTGQLEKVIPIRFTFPNGVKNNRSFRSTDKIGLVRKYIVVTLHENGLNHIKNFSISTTYPRKIFSEEEVTLEDAGLRSNVAMYITDLDA